MVHPGKSDSPMHDLSGTYDEDIYDSSAGMNYGEQSPDYSDSYSLSIIRSAKGRPNKQIKIYRSVPYFNEGIDNKIRELTSLVSHYYKFGFFPIKSTIIDAIEKEVDTINPSLSWGERKLAVRENLSTKIAELNSQRPKSVRINSGDWVTINPDYAKFHGRTNLNNRYKVVTKTVSARTLYSEGNSIHEWGYSP